MKFSETYNYGFDQIIKLYARFPWYLPLPAHLEHGWTPIGEALQSDLMDKRPLMLTFSLRRAKAWKKKSRIPVEVMGSPFVHYKNLRNINLDKNARGTIVFPSHSTYGLESEFSIEKYCLELKSLKATFQPVTICLFWLDFIEKAEIYRKFGFKVVSAGHKFSIGLNFVKNFYKILARHQYATSNEVGSYTFYAVDLGLPFFLTGLAPTIRNLGRDLNIGQSVKTENLEYGAIASRLFNTGPTTKISEEQKKFVDGEMGLNDCLSREKLGDLLNRINRLYRSPTKTIRFLVESTFLKILLNGPFGRLVVSARKKIARSRAAKSVA